MTLKTLPSPVAWPPAADSTNLAFSSTTIDASGEYVAGIMLVPSGVSVRGFTFRVNALTASGVLTGSIETVDGHVPTSTLVHAAATATVGVTGTGWHNITFSQDVTLPTGLVAFVVKRVSGAFNGTIAANATRTGYFPNHTVNFTGSVGFSRGLPGIVPFQAGPTYSLILPWVVPPAIGNQLVNIASGRQYGSLTSLPCKVRCRGISCHGNVGSAGASPAPEVRLYNTSNTLLASGAYKGFVGSYQGSTFTEFSTPVSLDPGDYYLVWHSNGGATEIRFLEYDATFIAMAGATHNSRQLTRASAGDAWSNDGNRWSPWSLVIDQLDDGQEEVSEGDLPDSVVYADTEAVVGNSVNVVPSVVGGSGSTFASSNLPAGLSINSSTGTITGTPTTRGTYTAIVSITSGGETTYTSARFEITEDETGQSSRRLTPPIIYNQLTQHGVA